MTLRLRLTLFYTLLVAAVLGIAGVSLHFLLYRRLHHDLDQSLTEASHLLNALMQNENGKPLLHDKGERIPSLPPDLIAVLSTANGAVQDSLGHVPQHFPTLEPGFTTWSHWRVLTRKTGSYVLSVLRSTNGIDRSLTRLDEGFLTVLPALLISAFLLGYAFTKRALAPVDRLTRGALELAQRRAWRESLPEPATKDELWRLSRATNTLLRALADVIETEQRFTSNAAHELRTPLTILRGRLDQATEQVAAPHARRAITSASRATDGLSNLVDGLLLLGRTEAGQDLTPERLTLDEVALDVADTLRPLFDAKGITLRVDLPSLPVAVEADRTALAILVRNVLDNALKFTTSGEVIMRMTRTRDGAYLDVTDTGPGILEEAQDHVFERFYRGHALPHTSGHGLGLALVKTIADWHGWSVCLGNAPGGGARFRLHVPVSRPNAHPGPPHNPTVAETRTPPARPNPARS